MRRDDALPLPFGATCRYVTVPRRNHQHAVREESASEQNHLQLAMVVPADVA